MILLAVASLALTASAALPPVFIDGAFVEIQDDLFYARKSYHLESAGMGVIDLTGFDLSCMNFYGFGALVMNSNNDYSLNADGVAMYWRLYAEGTQPSAWTSIDATARGNWWEYLDHKMNLLEGLTTGQTYRFEFYFKGTYGVTEFYYNNAGQNYTVRFTVPDMSEVRYLGGRIDMQRNGVHTIYGFSSREGRDPLSGLGRVNTLELTSALFSFYCPEDVEIDQVLLYYDNGDGWQYFPFPRRITDDNIIDFGTEWDFSLDLLRGLAEGDYTLKLVLVVLAGDKKYIIGEGDPNFELAFSYSRGSSGILGDLNGDGHVDVNDINMLICIVLGKE